MDDPPGGNDPSGLDRDGWRLRYSALIGAIDEWFLENYGEDVRDDLISSLGVNGWLHMGHGWYELVTCKEPLR